MTANSTRGTQWRAQSRTPRDRSRLVWENGEEVWVFRFGSVIVLRWSSKKGDYVDTSGRDGTTTMTMTRAATEATTEATTTPDDFVADGGGGYENGRRGERVNDDARGAGGKIGAARARTGARMTPYGDSGR